jgi:hypothetical protein
LNRLQQLPAGTEMSVYWWSHEHQLTPYMYVCVCVSVRANRATC